MKSNNFRMLESEGAVNSKSKRGVSDVLFASSQTQTNKKLSLPERNTRSHRQGCTTSNDNTVSRQDNGRINIFFEKVHCAKAVWEV
jgi:hypothetical protein